MNYDIISYNYYKTHYGLEGGAILDLRGRSAILKRYFRLKICGKTGSYLFQHSKRNAPIQFPQSGLVAVVLKPRVSFCISQPIIFCMFMR